MTTRLKAYEAIIPDHSTPPENERHVSRLRWGIYCTVIPTMVPLARCTGWFGHPFFCFLFFCFLFVVDIFFIVLRCFVFCLLLTFFSLCCVVLFFCLLLTFFSLCCVVLVVVEYVYYHQITLNLCHYVYPISPFSSSSLRDGKHTMNSSLSNELCRPVFVNWTNLSRDVPYYYCTCC